MSLRSMVGAHGTCRDEQFVKRVYRDVHGAAYKEIASSEGTCARSKPPGEFHKVRDAGKDRSPVFRIGRIDSRRCTSLDQSLCNSRAA